MPVKSVAKRTVVTVKPLRARAAKPRRKKSAAKPVATAAAVAPSPSVAVAAPAPSASAAPELCPACGAAKATPPAPRELTAKERAASAARLRQLRKKYPPTPLPKLRGKQATPIYEMFAEFRKVAAKYGGADDFFALMEQGRGRGRE